MKSTDKKQPKKVKDYIDYKDTIIDFNEDMISTNADIPEHLKHWEDIDNG